MPELHNLKSDSNSVLCLFLFLFGFVSLIVFWQLLVFNMVFSLMLNDMYITPETWELIFLTNILIISIRNE